MLDLQACRRRQDRFLTRLEEAGIPAALVSDPRDIYYLTGVLPESKIYPYPNLLFLGPGRGSWLATGLAAGEAAVDEKLSYPIGTFATINPDNHRRLCELVRDPLRRTQNLTAVGYQREALPRSVAEAVDFAASPRDWVVIDEILQDLQLRKDPDEVACVQRAVDATLAGYTRAQQVIRPGISEVEVMTECQAAAQRFSGRSHFYNGDFQSGEAG